MESAWSSITVEGAQVPPGALHEKLPLMLLPRKVVPVSYTHLTLPTSDLV